MSAKKRYVPKRRPLHAPPQGHPMDTWALYAVIGVFTVGTAFVMGRGRRG